MNNTYVIGDIHGGFKALLQIIQKIDPQKEDVFIFLGDYTDGWSESAQVIEWMIAFSHEYSCVFLKGNHDEDCRHWLQTGEATDNWLAHGGGSTIESYAPFSENDRQKHLAFFNSLKEYYIDDANRLFVHAGFSNRRGPAYEHYSSNFMWDRSLLETALALDKRLSKDDPFYPRRLSLFHEIYIGHTPTTGYGFDIPIQAANLWNMDTGAAYKGKLSALNIHTKEIFQSDIVNSFYPGEPGRNQ